MSALTNAKKIPPPTTQATSVTSDPVRQRRPARGQQGDDQSAHRRGSAGVRHLAMSVVTRRVSPRLDGEALRARGYGQPLIEKLCFRNWLRVLQRTWSGAETPPL